MLHSGRMEITMKKQAFNPYLPSYEYVSDGESYVFGDRLYVYGSYDKFNGKNFCLGDYVCLSRIDQLRPERWCAVRKRML